jgi:cytoskeletal protein CcmA (bactofilin family)
MAFTKKKTETMAINQEIQPTSINTIVNGTEIIGEIKSSGDIRIDGKLKGNINIKGRLVIGTTGVVDGEINCSNCDVSGKIVGKVNITELFSLKATAIVEGDVTTKKLAIEPGAVFTVTCKMNEEKPQTTSIPQPEKKDIK